MLHESGKRSRRERQALTSEFTIESGLLNSRWKSIFLRNDSRFRGESKREEGEEEGEEEEEWKSKQYKATMRIEAETGRDKATGAE